MIRVVLTGESSKPLWAIANALASGHPPETPRKAPPPARQFRFTAAQRLAVVAAYESGQTMSSLATEYQVKRESISKQLRRSGVEIRLRRQMSQAEIDESVRLYRTGLSLEQIGSRLGWDHNTIYRHLKKRGVQMRGPSDWKY